MRNETINTNDIRHQINSELATIETIVKEIRCNALYRPAPREFDAVARTIDSHLHQIKDLAYQLKQQEALL